MLRKLYSTAKNLYITHQRHFWAWPLGIVVRIAAGIRERQTVREQRNRSKSILNAMFATVLTTPPLACNPDAVTEIHTLTAHHHLRMYITALKSFLRFFNNVAIVAHDDGTLTAKDKSVLTANIPGIRIIDKKQADREMGALLADFPHSARFRRRVVNAMELFDNILLSRKNRIITMNSDVLFLKEPSEVISWITSDDERTIRIVHEELPAQQREFLKDRSCSFPPYVTLCLVCFHKRIFDTEYVEHVVAEARQNWFTAQNIYPLLFDKAAVDFDIGFFDKTTYQSSGVFTDGAVFRHYWTSTGRFTKLQSTDSAAVIGRLCR